MKEPRIVQVNAASPIDPKEIPKTVGMILAQTVLPSLQEAYANPEIYADFDGHHRAEKLVIPVADIIDGPLCCSIQIDILNQSTLLLRRHNL